MNNTIENYFNRLVDTVKQLSHEQAYNVAKELMDCYHRDGSIYIFGNGGSGSTASHIVGDFMKGVSYQMEKRFRVTCLNDNFSTLGAISNDISYEEVFVEPLKNFLRPGDLVIGISGSGNSMNVVKAMLYAKEKGVRTVAMCGYTGGKIKDIADVYFHAPIKDMEITEDIHLIGFHAIKQYIIELLKGTNISMGEVYDKRIKS
jgi:D-sedoheptulose 7-phosphate isomerase